MEVAPGLDALLDLGLCGARHVVASVFAVSAKAHVRMRSMFWSVMVTAAAWITASSKSLGGRPANDALRELGDAREEALA